MTTNYDQWCAEQMKDPEFREAYEALEAADQVSRLRHKRGITQAELAERMGSSQSSVARVESGSTLPNLRFLHRVAKALNAKVVVRLVPREEIAEEAPLEAKAEA